MPGIPRWFVIAAGSVAILVWVASFVAVLIVPGYKPDSMIGYIAMLVFGACFTAEAIKAGSKQKSDKSEPENKP